MQRKPANMIWPKKQKLPMHAYPTESDDVSAEVQAAALLDLERRAIDGYAEAMRAFAPEFVVSFIDGWDGLGWYVWSMEYPGDGSTSLTGRAHREDHDNELVLIARTIVRLEIENS